jgi:heme exporter protein C
MFHIPVAWVTVLAFLVSCVYSVIFLRKRNLEDDLRAAASAQLGLVFAVLATVTGSIFARITWGSFWNWDPRETSIFILLLIYGAYFALRSAVEDEDRRARLSAVYAIVAFVTVPFLVFVVPRVYFSLHPDIISTTTGSMNMGPRTLQVFLASLAGFTGLYAWLYQLAVRFSLRRHKDQQ